MRWDEIERFCVEEASRDLAAGSDVRPCLFAFCETAPLFVAFVRPFPRGGHGQPLIELLALAIPLGADRLAVSFAGRVMSLDDPIPPVLPGLGDLRQRALVIESAVAGPTTNGRRTPVRESVLHPFDVSDRGVTWLPPRRFGPSEGWVAHALAVSVGDGRRFSASTRELREQVRRCVVLGHALAVSPEVVDRLGLLDGVA